MEVFIGFLMFSHFPVLSKFQSVKIFREGDVLYALRETITEAEALKTFGQLPSINAWQRQMVGYKVDRRDQEVNIMISIYCI